MLTPFPLRFPLRPHLYVHQKRRFQPHRIRSTLLNPILTLAVELEIKVPERLRHEEAHLEVRELLAETLARAVGEGLGGGRGVSGVGGGGRRWEPAFGQEAVRAVKVGGGAGGG